MTTVNRFTQCFSRRLGVAASLAVTCLLAMSLLASAETYTFQLGFATLAGMIPNEVGQPLENEFHNAYNGDGIQRTTTGMLVWRKADNWTAFTNGYWTWLNSPCGLVRRLNDTRFPWEPEIGRGLDCNQAPVPLPADYVQPPLYLPETTPGATPTPTATPGATTPVINSFWADSGTIKPGESTVLHWELSGAVSADIDNGIGGVSSPGSVQVWPGSTTTYTLYARGTSTTVSASVTVEVKSGTDAPAGGLKGDANFKR